MAQKEFKLDSTRHRAVLPIFRLSFPNLFEAKAYIENGKPKGDPKFDATMIFDSMDDLKKKPQAYNSLVQAIMNANADFFGSDKSKWPKLAEIVKDGEEFVRKDTGEIYDGYEGKKILRARTGEKFPPRLSCANKTEATAANLYGGCYCQAVVDVIPFDMRDKSGKGQWGISLRLLQLTKVKEGKKFGGFTEVNFDEQESDAGYADESNEYGTNDEDSEF